MVTVKIDNFGGIAPRQHPTLLADGMAVTAHNCRLKTGKLVPLREPSLASAENYILMGGLTKIKDANSMHIWRRVDGGFDLLLYGGMTWSAPGNIAADDLMRIIISGETTESFGEVENTPVVLIRNNDYFYTVPLCKNVLAAPVVRRSSGEISPDEPNIRYTRFFVTWVDGYGMESPVSAPSKVYVEGEEPLDDDLEYLDGDTVMFNGIADIPADAEKVRVYKVITGAETGRVQFIKEVVATAAQNPFSVRVKDEDAGEVMPEIEAPPPDLQCICDVPGAFYCGFSPSSPKTVCFSDIDLIYSWPIAYRYDVADRIVALAVTSNSVFALTEGWPYVLSGTAPEAMSVAKLAGPAACVSARGVCVFRNAVYFVSNTGLMTIYNSSDAGTVCQNLTDKIFTKDQWLALNPSSCVMGQHDGALMLFFSLENGEHKALTIDLMDNAAVAVSTHDEAAKCLCVDTKEDRLYFVRNTGKEAE